MCGGPRTTWRSRLSLLPRGSWGTELVSLASKHLYPLSLFAGPNA